MSVAELDPIPQAIITAWRHQAPWPSPDQVEHDLVISRALCELYQHPKVGSTLAFRGGTALHKLFFPASGRFSEDLDFVQVTAEPIGETVNAIRECLDHWLGEPSWKQNQGRFTFNYRFTTEIEPVIQRKVKIEINTREHFSVLPLIKKSTQIDSRWYQGESEIVTYSLEELIGTKLRALYQRKKGRDLYDLWYVLQHADALDIGKLVEIFEHYMQMEGTEVSRAEFERNLRLKRESRVFNHDIAAAYNVVFKQVLCRLKGEAWKGSSE